MKHSWIVAIESNLNFFSYWHLESNINAAICDTLMKDLERMCYFKKDESKYYACKKEKANFFANPPPHTLIGKKIDKKILATYLKKRIYVQETDLAQLYLFEEENWQKWRKWKWYKYVYKIKITIHNANISIRKVWLLIFLDKVYSFVDFSRFR